MTVKHKYQECIRIFNNSSYILFYFLNFPHFDIDAFCNLAASWWKSLALMDNHSSLQFKVDGSDFIKVGNSLAHV